MHKDFYYFSIEVRRSYPRMSGYENRRPLREVAVERVHVFSWKSKHTAALENS